MRHGAKKIMQIANAQCRLEVAEKFSLQADKPCIYMSNHASLLDIPLIYALVPGEVRFIVKHSLFRIPIFGKASQLVGMLSNQIVAKQLALEAARHTRRCYWWFPEGTRNNGKTLLPFKVGGFNVAREIGAQIIPVAITGTAALLPTKKLQLHPGQQLCLRMGNPIDASCYSNITQQKSLMQRVHQCIVQLSEETYEKK